MIVLACTSALVFLIPIRMFNVRNKKKKEKIFSLLASIDSKIIVSEIIKLEIVEEELLVHSNFGSAHSSSQ